MNWISASFCLFYQTFYSFVLFLTIVTNLGKGFMLVGRTGIYIFYKVNFIIFKITIW